MPFLLVLTQCGQCESASTWPNYLFTATNTLPCKYTRERCSSVDLMALWMESGRREVYLHWFLVVLPMEWCHHLLEMLLWRSLVPRLLGGLGYLELEFVGVDVDEVNVYIHTHTYIPTRKDLPAGMSQSSLVIVCTCSVEACSQCKFLVVYWLISFWSSAVTCTNVLIMFVTFPLCRSYCIYSTCSCPTTNTRSGGVLSTTCSSSLFLGSCIRGASLIFSCSSGCIISWRWWEGSV